MDALIATGVSLTVDSVVGKGSCFRFSVLCEPAEAIKESEAPGLPEVVGPGPGSGYPDGLAGDDIPLAGRIMALADVYDALRSRRPYKEPFTHEKSSEIILQGAGKHFDPALIDVFRSVESEFAGIRQRMAEGTE